MIKSLAVILQIAMVLIGIAALAFLLGEPHLEGRNEHATLWEVYFHDPFLAYVYVASIPFFVALYQAFQALSLAGQDQVFSPAVGKASRTIKYCALSIIGFVVVSAAFLPFGDPDDRPPGVVMRLFVIFGSIVVVTVAARLERHFQPAVDKPSRNNFPA